MFSMIQAYVPAEDGLYGHSIDLGISDEDNAISFVSKIESYSGCSNRRLAQTQFVQRPFVQTS